MVFEVLFRRFERYLQGILEYGCGETYDKDM